MNRSKRLKVVIELAKKAEDEAAASFGEVASLLEKEKNKSLDLKRYYHEYEKSSNAKKNANSVKEIINSRNFLKQLSEAGQSQESLIRQVEHECQIKKNVWHKFHLKRRAFEGLASSIEKQELVKSNRNEQKMLDEWYNGRKK